MWSLASQMLRVACLALTVQAGAQNVPKEGLTRALGFGEHTPSRGSQGTSLDANSLLVGDDLPQPPELTAGASGGPWRGRMSRDGDAEIVQFTLCLTSKAWLQPSHKPTGSCLLRVAHLDPGPLLQLTRPLSVLSLAWGARGRRLLCG